MYLSQGISVDIPFVKSQNKYTTLKVSAMKLQIISSLSDSNFIISEVIGELYNTFTIEEFLFGEEPINEKFISVCDLIASKCHAFDTISDQNVLEDTIETLDSVINNYKGEELLVKYVS